MQTFICDRDFYITAKTLDYKRLGKQRVEAWQLYLSLTKFNYGWSKHPASKMWKGYEFALLIYGAIMCLEWRKRGYIDNMLDLFKIELLNMVNEGSTLVIPPWIDKHFIASHRSNLLRKDIAYYGQYGWTEPDNLPYIWPINH